MDKCGPCSGWGFLVGNSPTTHSHQMALRSSAKTTGPVNRSASRASARRSVLLPVRAEAPAAATTASKETLYGNLKVAYADHKMAPPSMVRGEGGAFVAIMHPIQLLASCGANSRLPILLRAHLHCADGCAGAWFDHAEV